MSREYIKAEQYRNQILKMKAEGKTHREIAESLGIEWETVRNWFFRFNRQMRKLAAGIKPRPKGRPRKDAEPRDIVAEQAYEIERLKMKNKLLRDFLRFGGRK